MRDATDRWIDRTELPPLAVETSVEIRDRDGDLLRVFTVADGRWRLDLSRAEIDPGYLRMLTRYEDRRFRDHGGVDPRALLRAAWQSVRAGRIVSGGSTLTMQVARLLEDSGTGAWAGKLRQMRVAWALERRLDKDRILALYARLAPMGGNLEGLRAATLAYFGKEPARLTPAEAALLVALPQSPEARRPDRHPDAAARARDRVLDRMARQGLLTWDEVAAARAEPAPRARRPFPALAPHLTARAQAEAPDAPVQRLTLDAGVQSRLEALAAAALRGRSDRLSVAILAADHRTGEILASVGSAGLGAQGAGLCRHDARAALARFDVETAGLRPGLRPGARPSRNTDRRPADVLRRLRAAELRRGLPRRNPGGARPAPFAEPARRPADRGHRPPEPRRRPATRRCRAGNPGGAAGPGRRARRAGTDARGSGAALCRAGQWRHGAAPALEVRREGRDRPHHDARLGLADRRNSHGSRPAAGRPGRPARLQDGHELWPPRRLGSRVRRRACGGRLDRPTRRHAGSGGLRRRHGRADPFRGLRPAETGARPAAAAAARNPSDRGLAPARAAQALPLRRRVGRRRRPAAAVLSARGRGPGSRRVGPGQGSGRAPAVHLAGQRAAGAHRRTRAGDPAGPAWPRPHRTERDRRGRPRIAGPDRPGVTCGAVVLGLDPRICRHEVLGFAGKRRVQMRRPPGRAWRGRARMAGGPRVEPEGEGGHR
ncbi:penicillin-binding protein 1C [Pseudooceanicola batsensis HTCC2597]|uniref:peptidoglycan glycosyltransferase n=1 Tax=Pseudooceanicola batsensis (strain ATCC BAA-863 / DSM 15984 / KCTC 12145 / HTCC2597) TaxID=252305 RepID=A3U264_PSEBH|nr:penicillin-binding protein 1C [Pseudooceanicola batsensis HTCC2597]